MLLESVSSDPRNRHAQSLALLSHEKSPIMVSLMLFASGNIKQKESYAVKTGIEWLLFLSSQSAVKISFVRRGAEGRILTKRYRSFF